MRIEALQVLSVGYRKGLIPPTGGRVWEVGSGLNPSPEILDHLPGNFFAPSALNIVFCALFSTVTYILHCFI